MKHSTALGRDLSITLWDPSRRPDPFPFYADLRRNSPVVPAKIPGRGNVWVVSRYEDVVTILKDARFSNDGKATGASSPWFGGFWTPKAVKALASSMVCVDDPAHYRLRNLVHKAFTPRAIETMQARVEQIAHDLLDAMARKPEVDLIADYALPLPLTVISELLGIPDAQRAEFQRRITGLTEPDPSLVLRVVKWLPKLMRLVRFLQRLVEFRRRNPDDRLITTLLRAEDGGDRLSRDELVATVFLLLFAGHETTVNLIGSGVLALLDHPEQKHLLAEKPALIGNAVEELLRFTNPVEAVAMRFAKEDVSLSGVIVPRSSTVLGLISSANRDEAAFKNADTLDIERADNNRHLAFGVGIHYCLGAPLARLEGRIAIGALLSRFPNLSLAAPRHSLQWRNSEGLRGLKAMPVRLG